jgi:hypothetical protein
VFRFLSCHRGATDINTSGAIERFYNKYCRNNTFIPVKICNEMYVSDKYVWNKVQNMGLIFLFRYPISCYTCSETEMGNICTLRGSTRNVRNTDKPLNVRDITKFTFCRSITWYLTVCIFMSV